MDYHNGIVTHPEPDILEYEVKWALGSTAANEVSWGDGIPAELFKNPKNYAVKVLYSICQQIWETQQLPQDWKMSILIPVPKKGSVKTTGWLLLGRKAMTNLDSVLKSKDITLSTKVHIVKALVFPVAVYRCESWTIKNAKHWRINVFEPGLVICFTLDNIHVLMLFSWNIPPSPSPTESKRLFYISMSLFLFCI